MNNNNNNIIMVKVFNLMNYISNSLYNSYNHQNKKPPPLVRQNAFRKNDVSNYNVNIVYVL